MAKKKNNNDDNYSQKARTKINSTKILEFMQLYGLETRYNVLSMKTECRWRALCSENKTLFNWQIKSWHDISDREVNWIWTMLNDDSMVCKVSDIHNVINSELTPAYNPVTQYLLDNIICDNQHDYIGELASHVHIKPARGQTEEEAQREFTKMFRKWFVGMVAGALYNDVVNNVILMLIGPQGCFKSTFFYYLLPPELRRYYKIKTDFHNIDKDDRLSMTTHWLICMDELNSMTHKESRMINAAVTMRVVNERMPYARNVEQRKHIASFCATGNNPNFINDITGTRRWLPFEVTGIDNPATLEYNHQQLYAHAMQLLIGKFKYWFTQDEVDTVNKRNTRFQVANQEMELIIRCYDLPQLGDNCVMVTTAEVQERLRSFGHLSRDASPVAIGIAMHKLGFETKHTRSGNRYLVRERSLAEIEQLRQQEANEYMGSEPF